MPQYTQLSLFDQIPIKHCHKCGRDLPATLEFWHRAKKRGKSILASQCKECCRARAKKWADDNLERNRARAREWYWDDPERARQSAKDWHKNNPDKVKTYRDAHVEERRAYKHTPEYKAKAAEYRKRKAKELVAYNRQYRETHPGWINEVGRNWRKRNPERAKATMHRRLARKHNAMGSYTADDVKRQYAEQEGRCAYCGISIYMDVPKDVHVDHVVPLSRGGSNGPDNLLLTCLSCNSSKGSKSVAEWMTVRGW